MLAAAYAQNGPALLFLKGATFKSAGKCTQNGPFSNLSLFALYLHNERMFDFAITCEHACV
jgi:hypothetical protein